MINSQYLNHCINEGQVELVIIMLSMVLSQLMEILQLVVLRHLLNLQVGALIDALLTSALTPPSPPPPPPPFAILSVCCRLHEQIGLI